MTGFWFLLHVVLTIYGISQSTMRWEYEDETKLQLLSIINGILITAVLTLAYFGGVYVYITGHEGNLVAFGAWLLLTLFAYGAMIFRKGLVGVAITIFGLFVYYQIGAFNNLEGIL